MPVTRSAKHPSVSRLRAIARRLLDAAPLCAIGTVTAAERAHINTAYFAWSPTFDIVWLSAPEAQHSRNIRTRGSAAVAVFRSRQTWGGRDQGIQVFGRARELRGRASLDAERLYAGRFRAYDADLSLYRFYRLRPTRMKLFDERVLGGGTFVTVAVRRGRLAWARTEWISGDAG